MTKRPPTQGFTLVEVVLAIGVATFALVSIIGLLSTALNTDASAGRDTTLATMSDYVLTELRTAPFDALWAADPTTVTNPTPSTNTPTSSTYYFTSEGAPVAADQLSATPDVAYICTVLKTPDPLTQNNDTGYYNALKLQLQFSWPINGTQAAQNATTRFIYASIARR